MYITKDDITDRLALALIDAMGDEKLAQYIQLADDELLGIAEQNNVTDGSVLKGDDMHPKVREYVVKYMCTRIFLDYMEVNDAANRESDKYFMKYQIYNDECLRILPTITAEMLSYTTLSAEQRVSGGRLWRG